LLLLFVQYWMKELNTKNMLQEKRAKCFLRNPLTEKKKR